MAGPVLVAIDDNPDLLRDVERELRDRYERHYRVICVGSDVGITCLEDLADAGEDVALILAGQRLAGRSGAELLGEYGASIRMRSMCCSSGGASRRPHDERSHRPWPDRSLSGSVPQRLPMSSSIPGFGFCWTGPTCGGWLQTPCTSSAIPGPAERTSCAVLGRCALPTFCLADSPEGRGLLATAGTAPTLPLPLLLFPDGTVLSNPSDMDVARAAGTTIDPEGLDFDLVIVGGGPAVCRQPCTALQRDCARSSSTRAAWVGKPRPARRFAAPRLPRGVSGGISLAGRTSKP